LESKTDPEAKAAIQGYITPVADGLNALIQNHEACALPFLDGHIIDVTLELIFLVFAGRHDIAKACCASQCF
jgi:hypothetical protein